ncbi:DegT/DnrJ/EryC1/StrS family aminotransferase [Ekhidna sp.]|uniref:DegT/DnrJ/EryC1/StrS family aminotransferase n=1 Tax=Ekhidna sp. TaxID=2608089 RepID=UPI003296CB57
MIPIMEPDLSGNERKYLIDAFDSGWISSKGKYVEQLENGLAAYHDADHVLAVSNGTVALHLGMVSLGIGPGDEVIVPNLTFAASLNTVIHAGATPVLAEVDQETYNIDCRKIEKYISSKTKAIMAVHLYGNPCNMELIQAIAKQHDLLIIEDNAEGLGSTYGTRKTGSIGDIGTFSFYGNKTITTGEGGAIIFKSKEVYEHAKVLRDHGMSPEKRYWHEYIGYNYRLTNIQAAIGCAQLERLDHILNKKRNIADQYISELSSVDSIRFQKSLGNSTNSHWLFTPLFHNLSRDKLGIYLQKNGVESRPAFYPMSEMPAYSKYVKEDYSISESIAKSGLSLPSFPSLSEKEIDLITKTIKKFYE